MPLFTDDTHLLRRFVPVTVNYTMTDLLPELERTTHAVLISFLGQTLTDQIVLLADADPAPTGHLARALELSRTCVGRLGFVAHLPFAETQIGDDGITVTANEGRKAAFEYQLRNMKRELSDSGWLALDKLIALVAQNPGTFPGWSSSPYKEEYESTLFKSPVEFSRFYPIQDRWLTFMALRPFITSVEDTRATELQQRIDVLADAAIKTRLSKVLKRAVAYQAVLDALPTLSIELNGNNVQVNYASQYGNVAFFQPPDQKQLTWVMDNLLKFADLSWNLVCDDLAKQENAPGETASGSGRVDNTHSSIIMF